VRYFLGIDGGGSKCDAVVIDESGVVRGWGRGGPTTYVSPEAAATASREALAEALGNLSVSELWMGAICTSVYATDWLKDRGTAVHRFLIDETDACFAAAGRTWGVMVHAGTGSWVQGRTADGRQARVGGMGPIVGDDGSGWDIGLRGIKAALRSSWSARTHTSLAEAVPPVLGVSRLGSIVGRPITTGQVTRAQIAAVAPVVVSEAARGDAVAIRALEQAAASLADLCELVLDELQIIGQGYPLIGMAGVIQGAPLYWRLFSERMLECDPTLVPEVPTLKMAVGAALEAMRRAGVEVSPDLRGQVAKTQAAFAASQVAACE